MSGRTPPRRRAGPAPVAPRGFALCLVLVLLALGPVGAPEGGSALRGQEASQQVGSWAPLIRILPRVGLLSPDTYFYEEFKNFSGDGFIEWTTGSLGRAALLGLGVEAVFEDLGFSLRGEISRSFEGWLAAGHGVLIPRFYFQPPEVVTTWFDVPASVTFLSLQAILPTRFTFHGVQPFVLAGYTGKWYGFGPPTGENTVEAILPSDGWTPSLDLGGGITIRLFGVALEAQVRDNINRYWGKTQHDLVFSGGLAWTVR
jgi:hypothetical protein